MPRLAKRQFVVTLSPVGRVLLGDYIHRVAFAPGGTRLAACSASGQVAVWETPSLNPAGEIKGHQQPAMTLAWHPKRQELVTGGQDGVVRIWAADT